MTTKQSVGEAELKDASFNDERGGLSGCPGQRQFVDNSRSNACANTQDPGNARHESALSNARKSAPFKVRCDHWNAGGIRCTASAAVTLHTPSGKRVPGGPLCIPCAQAVVNEYAEKLHEHWTVRELVVLEEKNRPVGWVYCVMNYAVECRDVVSGVTGCFLFDPGRWLATGEHRAISPVFADLAAFHRWNQANGRPGGPAYLKRLVQLGGSPEH